MDDLVAGAARELELLKYSNKAKFVEWADGNWEPFQRSETSPGWGAPKRCYHNAYWAACCDPTLKLYTGWATKPSIGNIPIQHAWVVTKDGLVCDFTPSWAEEASVMYYGVQVPLFIARKAFAIDESERCTNDFWGDLQQAPA